MGTGRVVSLGVLAVSLSTAGADPRSLVHTYEYSTVPEGNTTLELWHTQARATSDGGSPHLYQGILEIEHGITEKLDVGFLTVLEQIEGATPSAGVHMTQARLESRYRFANRAEWPIDTELMLAAAKAFGDSLYRFEGRVIGARDFDDLTLAANAIASIGVWTDAPDEPFAFGWGAGATYQVHNKVRVGVESWGTVVDGDLAASLGPALALWPASKLWTAITAGFGLTGEPAGIAQSYVSVRAIVGIEL